LILAVPAAAALVAWVLWDQAQVRRDAQEAREAVASGDYERAREPLANWRRRRPDSLEALRLQARVFLGLGRNEEAAETLRALREQGGTGAPVEALEAVLLARAGRHGEAEPILLRVDDRRDSPDPLIAEALARVYLETFRLGAAQAVIDRWARAAPDDPTPYLWRAEIHERSSDDPEPLIGDYLEALARQPDLGEAQRELAESLRRANRLDEARARFAAYLEQHPDDTEALVGAARTALSLADFDEAARHLDRALALDPKLSVAFHERGGLSLNRNQPVKAWEDLSRAVELEPDNPDYRARLALALARLGRSQEAEAEAKRAEALRAEREELLRLRDRLVRSPQDRAVQCEAARWLIEHGHDEEGLRWARKVLAEEPGNRGMHALLADYFDRRGEAGLANYHRFQLGPSP
jgi:predicted Zn-dependent protease